MLFPDTNSTNFPLSVKNNMNELIKQDYNSRDFLKYHQFIVYQYLIHNENARGLLIFHEMGMGKSILAVALAEYYRNHDPDKQIIVLLSKSLQKNFKINIKKYVDENNPTSTPHTDDMIDRTYKFISLNASNMYTQMSKVDKSPEEIEVDKQLKEFTDIIEKEDFLENSVLIIDEYHNLSNSITNGSYNAIRLYDIIMKTKNIKLLFLTGTPIINNPFELAPTFNMLHTQTKPMSEPPLFPELQREFYSYFVDDKTKCIKNQDIFENRIFGLVSYFGGMYFGEKTKDGFPYEYPLDVIKIEMSPEQFSSYDAARDSEREEASQKKKRPVSDRFSSKSSSTSSYRVKSRQISNFNIPEYALTHLGKKVVKHIDKIDNYDLTNLDITSPKFKKILENIKSHKDELGLIYSEFVSGEGIAIFSKILDHYGYTCWQHNIKLKDDESVYDLHIYNEAPKVDLIDINKETDTHLTEEKSNKKIVKKRSSKRNIKKYDTNIKKQYAVITGDIDIELRSKIIQAFNNKNNINGQHISLLLISKTGAEGLDLKNVRHVHICEPYWNMARVEQVIARASRYLSHVDLPKSEQTVQPYIYLSDYPHDYNMKKKKEETTDIEIYTEALKNKKLINQFNIALANASIDCSLHEPKFSKSVRSLIKCKMCSPTDVPLYNSILSRDFKVDNPCKQLNSDEIDATGINVDGTTYYYSKSDGKSDGKSNYDIYKFDKTLKVYIPLQSHEYPYSEILTKLY